MRVLVGRAPMRDIEQAVSADKDPEERKVTLCDFIQ